MRAIRPELIKEDRQEEHTLPAAVLVLSKDMTDRTKKVLRELFIDELVYLELFTPLERRDHHVGRVLYV